jgi:hypothetical protein
MPIPLITDLANDRSIKKNLFRILLFVGFVIILDYVVSVLLLKGIENNYGLKTDSDILLIGHSHLMLAIDKKRLEKSTRLKVSKYTREGVNVSDRKIMIDHYFETCTGKPKFVVLGIDPWLFTGEGLSSNSYLLFLPFMDTPEVNKYIKETASGKFDYLKANWVRTSRFNSTLLNASIRGYLKNWDNLKIGTVDTIMLNKEITDGNFRHITLSHDLIKDFSASLGFLNKEHVNVILLNTPVYRPLLAAQVSDYKHVMFLIDSIKKVECPEAILVDLVPHFSSQSSYFFDPIHMNPLGQKKVTEYFSEVLDSINKLKTEVSKK